MNDASRKLDEFARKERRKAIVSVLSVILFIIPIYLWMVMPPMGEVTEVRGIVLRMTGIPSDAGETLFLLVELENGGNVRSRISNASYYKQGGVVLLDRHEPLLFGRSVYKFRKYIDTKK